MKEVGNWNQDRFRSRPKPKLPNNDHIIIVPKSKHAHYVLSGWDDIELRSHRLVSPSSEV